MWRGSDHSRGNLGSTSPLGSTLMPHLPVPITVTPAPNPRTLPQTAAPRGHRLCAAFRDPQTLTMTPQGEAGGLTGRPGGLRTPASGRADWDNWAGAVEGSSGLWLGKEENTSCKVTWELSRVRSNPQHLGGRRTQTSEPKPHSSVPEHFKDRPPVLLPACPPAATLLPTSFCASAALLSPPPFIRGLVLHTCTLPPNSSLVPSSEEWSVATKTPAHCLNHPHPASALASPAAYMEAQH